jgi:hypothetical protein
MQVTYAKPIYIKNKKSGSLSCSFKVYSQYAREVVHVRFSEHVPRKRKIMRRSCEVEKQYEKEKAAEEERKKDEKILRKVKETEEKGKGD